MNHGKAAAACDEDGVLDPGALEILRRSPCDPRIDERNQIAASIADGPLKNFRVILALHKVGLYTCDAGVKMAREALKVAA